jgi:hypothetical protein
MFSKKRLLFSVALLFILLIGSVSSQTPSWKFIVYGDTRTDDADHRKVLQSISENTPDFEFIINVGDVVQKGHVTSQWNTWKNALTDKLGSTLLSGPQRYYSCPGNHDNV